jgi:hypothetical protein
MPGLVPGFHVLLGLDAKDVDGRVNPGDDDEVLRLQDQLLHPPVQKFRHIKRVR